MAQKKNERIAKMDEEAELAHFLKLMDDLHKMETMKETVSTTLFLEKEREEIEKHIINAKIRTGRNLYWSGKLLKLNALIDDIPKLIKEQEAQLRSLKAKKKKE